MSIDTSFCFRMSSSRAMSRRRPVGGGRGASPAPPLNQSTHRMKPGTPLTNNQPSTSDSPSSSSGISVARQALAKCTVERSQSHVTPRETNRLFETAGNRPRRSCDVPFRPGIGSHDGPPQMTLILMGAQAVGKSAMVNQFLWEIFLREYRPTVEEFNWIEYGSNGVEETRSDTSEQHHKRVSGDGSASFLLQIIDSAGSRDFLAMRHLYYRIGDAFMIVYSLTDPLSLAEALLMMREIRERNSNKQVPILLVANKADLEETAATSTAPVEQPFKNRQFTDRPQVVNGGDEDCPQNVEATKISAKDLEQVKKAFYRLIEEMVRQRRLMGRPIGPGGSGDSGGNGGGGGGRSLLLQLQKRRQSMPSRRTANELGIDAEALERLVRKHDSHSKGACVLS